MTRNESLSEWALELNTIDSELEKAANHILEDCEKLVQTAGNSPEVQGMVTNIMENCSFHDLNSQRLRKIIRGLGELIQAEGVILQGNSTCYSSLSQGLASGPQRPEVALSQSAVEDILKN